MKGNGKKKSKLDKLKEQTFKTYSSWKKTYCPALNAEVLFTRRGWDHVYTSKWRTKAEYERRLKSLPHSKKAIETATKIKETRRYPDCIMYEVQENVGGIIASALISLKNKKYYFFSNFKE